MTATKKPARRKIDWEAVEKEYRSGQVSNVMLGEKHGVSEGAIRKRAREGGWQKDLAATVQKRIKEELVRDEVRTEVRDTNATDREIIEQAAATGAQVVRTHRKDIRTAAQLAAGMLAELQEPDSELKLNQRAGILRDLSVVQKNLITLERQAYNLDEASSEESYEDRLVRLVGDN